MARPAKRLFLASLVLLSLAPAPLLFQPKRWDVISGHLQGRIQVADGCSVFTPGIFNHEERFERTRPLVRELKREGGLVLYDTPIGTLWYRAGSWTLPALVEESQNDAYGLGSLIKPGDVVVDVGANVGTDTKRALEAGAKLVLAIEPEPLTLECLRRNLAAEIAAGRVLVVPKGAWDREDTLELNVDEANAGGSTFLWKTGGPVVKVPLTTIDRIVAENNVARVDLIKMDIEGAEKNALLGAAETIRKFKPNLSLVLEHGLHDVTTLPEVVRRIRNDYTLKLTPCTKTLNLIHPEVALLTR